MRPNDLRTSSVQNIPSIFDTIFTRLRNCLFWNPKAHHCIYESLPTLIQFSPVYIFTHTVSVRCIFILCILNYWFFFASVLPLATLR